MKVELLLADSGEVDSVGKLHALGIGWSNTISPTPPMAVLLLFEILPDENEILGHPLTFNLSLCKQNGEQFLTPGPDGNNHPIRIQGDITINAPDEPQAGLPVGLPLVLNVSPGIPLPEQNLYSWKVIITAKGNNEKLASDSATFFVSKRTQPSQPPQTNSQT